MQRLARLMPQVLACASCIAPGAAFGAESPVVVQRYTEGQWTLQIASDRFSGEKSCRLRGARGKIVYVADALGFRFAPNRDTTAGWLRIDGGAALRWRDLRPELARLGVAIDGRNLAAPTGGIVWVPAAMLESARTLAVQWRPGERAQRFNVEGVVAIRDRARSQGCRPEVRFVL